MDATDGFWALEKLEDGWGYVLYHDQKLPTHNFDDLPTEAFQNIVEALLDEVEEFNKSGSSPPAA